MSTMDLTTWRDGIAYQLKERDEHESRFDLFVKTFEASVDRVLEAEKTGTPAKTQSQDYQLPELYSKLSVAEESLAAITAQKKQLERELTLTKSQLAAASSQLRNVRDEGQVRSSTVQHLQDEILALQIQLNLSEERVEKLEVENSALVERWMAKVAGEADKLNDANAFIESLGRIRKT